jgi:hypothetical protein
MVIKKVFILVSAGCLRDFLARGLDQPVEAAVAKLMPFAPHWACEGFTTFVTVLAAEVLWMMAEEALRAWLRSRAERARSQGTA